MKQKHINIYHATGINSEFLPEEFYLLRKNNKAAAAGDKLKRMPNLTVEQENEHIYSNPNHPLREKIQKFTYQCQFLISINKKKINRYFQEQNYPELFQLYELYLTSLFNGKKKEEIRQLFLTQQITDSAYIYSMKCYELIERNVRDYTYIKYKNPENALETTENFYMIKIKENTTAKQDALLFLQKYQLLLTVINGSLFSDQIQILEDIYRKWNS